MDFDSSLVPVWITSVAAAGSAVYAIVRNGRRSKKQDAELKAELKAELSAITRKLEHPDTGLDAIQRSVSAMGLNCARTTAEFAGQIARNKEDIGRLREERGGKK